MPLLPTFCRTSNLALLRILAVYGLLLLPASSLSAAEGILELHGLIDEAVRNNPALRAAAARQRASAHKAPQAKSLPDPMIMAGYQNEGWDSYTYGEMEGAQWMYSVSQMFPFPGKRALKGEMAVREAESAGAMYDAARLSLIAQLKGLYYDLFLTHKDLELIRERTALFALVEEAALARYATGMASQQEVLMAQTEKYMLLEREEMLKQKQLSLAAMLNAAAGRETGIQLGRPAEPVPQAWTESPEESTRQALAGSPEIRALEKMAAAADAGVRMAAKEYYPDITVAGSVFTRSGEFDDMWNVTTTLNIPLYYRSRQRPALQEAEANLAGARQELEAARLKIAAEVRDNYAMLRTAERLIDLYRQGLIPKTRQDFELSLTGYRAGKVEGMTVVSRLKSLLDFETQYWTQVVEREKAIARLESITGTATGPR